MGGKLETDGQEALEACRRIIGQVICAGTLARGERLAEPIDHAAVGAIVRKVEQRDSALDERDMWRRLALAWEAPENGPEWQVELDAAMDQIRATGVDPATGEEREHGVEDPPPADSTG